MPVCASTGAARHERGPWRDRARQVGRLSHAHPVPAARPGDFAFGFAKSAQANISKADLALLKDAATEALGWNGEELDRLVASGTLVEIKDEYED